MKTNELKDKKVAILYICTGTYVVFWKDFFRSYEKNFLPNCRKEYFVFTDAEALYGDDKCERIHRIFQNNLGWPDNTLKRYHIFSTIKDTLAEFDYCFFMNANCLCKGKVTEEEFLPVTEPLLVVKHPGFWKKSVSQYTYDRNPQSTSYIKEGEGTYYVCGGVNGGQAKAFLELTEKIKENVDLDEEKGIVALWHDESHLNRYILNRDDFRILSPAYCYPEGWKMPFEKKILIREKSKWINVDEIKNNKKETISLVKKIKRKIKGCICK